MGDSMGAIAGLNIAAEGDIEELVGWVGVSPSWTCRGPREEGPLVAAMPTGRTAGPAGPSTPSGWRRCPCRFRVTVTEADTVVPAQTGVAFAERVGGEVTACRAATRRVETTTAWGWSSTCWSADG